MSEWMSRCVDSVDDLLKLLPQILQSKLRSCECTALCCSRLTACPKVLPQISHAKGLVPLWDLRTCTSSPCGVENT